MTTKELYTYIKRTGVLLVGDLRFRIVVLDAKSRFGRTDLLVKPIAGDGQEWKSLDASLILDEKPATSTR